MAQPAVSIVIPSWNGRQLLETCLAAVGRQTVESLEAIVVDNASTDDTLTFLDQHHPEVRVVQRDDNGGFAVATNAGIRVAAGRTVAFLNNDAFPEPHWLEELLACLERHERAAAATPKVLALDRRVIDAAGDIYTLYLRAYPRGRGEVDCGQYEDEVEVFAATGTASLWRADVLRELGLLDEDIFFGYEDVDLSFRARLAGYECWYAPRAVVRHVGGASSSERRAEFVHFHAVRNRWKVIIKDVPSPLVLRSVHRLVFAEALSVAHAIREGALHLTLRAYGDVLRSLPRWMRARRSIQATKRTDNSHLYRRLTRGYPGLTARIRRAVTGQAPPSA